MSQREGTGDIVELRLLTSESLVALSVLGFPFAFEGVDYQFGGGSICYGQHDLGRDQQSVRVWTDECDSFGPPLTKFLHRRFGVCNRSTRLDSGSGKDP